MSRGGRWNEGWVCESGAVGGEEVVHEGGALLLQDAAVDLGAVVEAAVADDVPEGADGAGLGLPGAEDDTGDAGQDKGTGAHGAGLDGHGEGAAFETPAVAEAGGGGAKGEDLGVGGGVAEALPGVAGGGEFPAVAVDDDGPDGNVGTGLASGPQRGADQLLVTAGHGRRVRRTRG